MGLGFRYGNYAGANWTGGVEGGGREAFTKEPISPTDALARAHDWGYANAIDAARGESGPGAATPEVYNALIWAADLALLDGLRARILELQELSKTMDRNEWNDLYFKEYTAAGFMHAAFSYVTPFYTYNPEVVISVAEKYNLPLPALPGDPNQNPLPTPLPSLKPRELPLAPINRGPIPVPPIPVLPRKDPLAFDLNSDGTIETVSKENGVNFDLDNNGFAERTSWVGKNDALLVLDRDANGFINGGAELFGNETRLQNGQLALNGFEALREQKGSNKRGQHRIVFPT